MYFSSNKTHLIMQEIKIHIIYRWEGWINTCITKKMFIYLLIEDKGVVHVGLVD